MTRRVVLIQSDVLGGPDEGLGRILMATYLRVLSGKQDLPGAIVLLNAGVMLARRGDETSEHLSALRSRGVDILLCRTCVDYFGIESDVSVGEIRGMADIQDTLSSHDVLTL